MPDKLLDKYLGRRKEVLNLSDQEEGTEDLGVFGWLRGSRERAVMLEIRHRDGRVTALGYAWMDLVEYDPSEGITLRFSGKTVKILGSNLNSEILPNMRLLDGIIRQKVPWIIESNETMSIQLTRKSILIEKVQVT